MERYYSQIIGEEILTETGDRAGRIFDVLINHENGKTVGFLLYPAGNRVVAPNDLIFWNERFMIRDLDDIGELEDIIKVQEVLTQKVPIIKNKVVTKKGVELGHVLDFALDTRFFTITKILVAKTFFGFFPHEEKIFHWEDILEITKEKIIIRNPIEKIPVKERKTESIKGKLRIDVAPTG